MSVPAPQLPSEPPICDYEGSTYRTDFWEGQGRDYEDQVERAAIERLLPPRGHRLLDVGAGFGRLTDLYADYDEIVLLDYSQSQLEYARERLGDDRYVYVAADIYRLPIATDTVDTSVMVRVMHHLADVPAALAQLGRALCAGGVLVLEFANKRHVKNVIRYLAGQGVNPFEQEPYEFANLHFDFHPKWVDARLRDAGLETRHRLSVSLFRSRALKRILPTPLLVKMDRALQRVMAPATLGPSVFVSALGGRKLPAGHQAVCRAGDALLFRCPGCAHEPLDRVGDRMICAACGAEYPIENGIYVFK